MIRNWRYILLDVVLTFLSIIIGLIQRLEIIYVVYFIRAVWHFIIVALFVRPAFLYIFGTYNRLWRQASTRAYIRLASAILAGSAVLAPVTLFWLYPRWMVTIPGSLLAIEAMTSLLLLGGVRLSLMVLDKNIVNGNAKAHNPMRLKERTLIIGAGTAGTLIVQEMRVNS